MYRCTKTTWGVSILGFEIADKSFDGIVADMKSDFGDFHVSGQQ